MSYLKGHGTRSTPQTEPIPGKSQVLNSAGGYSFGVDKWSRLNRFLILGSEGGSYYVGEQKLTKENTVALRECLSEDHKRTVDIITSVSVSGRAPKNDPAIFALAVACSTGSDAEKRYALDKIPDVCRIGTHLFTFAELVQDQRGWGRGLRRGVAAWYEREDVGRLAYQSVKYRQRNGWTHRDLLRLSHPEAPTAEHKSLYSWVTHGDSEEWQAAFKEGKPAPESMKAVEAFERAQRAESPAASAKLIEEYGGTLPREAILTEHASKPEVQVALLEAGMPMTALIRNLANLTRSEVIKPMGGQTALVCEQLRDADRIKKARVHPIAILTALKTYEAGYSVRGSNTWTPVQAVVDALDDAFYLAFDNIESTGKNHVLGIDVSGSMTMGMVAGVPGLTPNVAAAAMAMVTARTESNYVINGFAHEFRDLGISDRDRLADAMQKTQSHSFGGTDCALPMAWAIKHKIEVDAFVVYTDNETWAGGGPRYRGFGYHGTPDVVSQGHPSQELERYRQSMGRDAKLIVVGMVSNDFSIADPADPGMLDIVGFDASAPAVMADFIR